MQKKAITACSFQQGLGSQQAGRLKNSPSYRPLTNTRCRVLPLPQLNISAEVASLLDLQLGSTTACSGSVFAFRPETD